MIVFDGADDDTGKVLCQTGFANAGHHGTGDIFILGEFFMKNVVAVFDVGASKMMFAPNANYPDNDQLYWSLSCMQIWKCLHEFFRLVYISVMEYCPYFIENISFRILLSTFP